MSAPISPLVSIRERLQYLAGQLRDVVYDWNVDHAQQHPRIDLHMNAQTRLGWAIARANSVYVELHYDQDARLHRRWNAWTRLTLRDGQTLNVSASAATGPAAVRKVRRQLVRELHDFHPESGPEPHPGA